MQCSDRIFLVWIKVDFSVHFQWHFLIPLTPPAVVLFVIAERRVFGCRAYVLLVRGYLNVAINIDASTRINLFFVMR